MLRSEREWEELHIEWECMCVSFGGSRGISGLFSRWLQWAKLYCRQPFLYLQGPASQTYLPYVCPFHLRDNQWDLIPCPNKLIPQLTCKSKVQGQMQIPERQTVPNLAVNQLITHRMTQFVMETWHTQTCRLTHTHTHTKGGNEKLLFFCFQSKMSLFHTQNSACMPLCANACLYMCVCECVCVYVPADFFFPCFSLPFLCWPPAPACVPIWFVSVAFSFGRGA